MSLHTQLVEIQGLTIGYRTSSGRLVDVVSDVTLNIAAGEALGLVGESGCGKSTLAAAFMGYLRTGSVRRSGGVRVDGVDVFAATSRELQRMRGKTAAFVPQDAGQALTPSMRVGAQIVESLEAHRGLDGRRARAEATELLRLMRLPAPEALARRYPHQLSGGQQQRVAIAMALAGEPKILILDEPTTGLDVTTQTHMLGLLDDIRARTGAAMLYVSHDLGAIAVVSERVGVMYAGKLIEVGPAAEVLAYPRHPYTRGLLAAVPRISGGHLPEGLAGRPPIPGEERPACAFAPRCFLASEASFTVVPELRGVSPGEQRHMVRCHNFESTPPLEQASLDSRTPDALRVRLQSERLVEIDSVSATYAGTGITAAVQNLLQRVLGRPSAPPTVADISLTIARGETLALVGESGSGKSTLARILAGLHEPTAGRLRFDGHDLKFPVVRRSLADRQAMQLVFQNPDASLNPRQTIRRILERPLQLFSELSRGRRRERVEELLREVGLGTPHLSRFPAQLSGGEKQRVAIARAFAAGPAIVLSDEIVSSLDVSVQATILHLLNRLQAEQGFACLFISHDLAVVRAIADRVAVLYLGRLCEVGPVSAVYDPPYHPYTETLLAAVLEPVPGTRSELLARGAEAEAGPPERGCVFQNRCPRRIGEICDQEQPPWRTTRDGAHAIRCHIELEDLERLASGTAKSKIEPTERISGLGGLRAVARDDAVWPSA